MYVFKHIHIYRSAASERLASRCRRTCAGCCLMSSYTHIGYTYTYMNMFTCMYDTFTYEEYKLVVKIIKNILGLIK